MFKLGLVLSLTAALALAKNFDVCPVDQVACPQDCQPPDCACAGHEPDVPVLDRPQIIYLTFDDGMTAEFDEKFYTELFMPDADGKYKYTNPNDCPIKATFFVSANSNDYEVVRSFTDVIDFTYLSRSIDNEYSIRPAIVLGRT